MQKRTTQGEKDALRETDGKGYEAHLIGKQKGKYLEWKSSNTDKVREMMEELPKRKVNTS